ncbi:Tolloid-like protein 2 [Tupaia chinensis]|uniref:Tolloid-like protein 2 n=1 Tax=Tupaia chinensis TaxID=246437 RepID=L9JFB3_TUPCH|nr:Tolloid-like protein 2 [Tupaia chinensis]
MPRATALGPLVSLLLLPPLPRGAQGLGEHTDAASHSSALEGGESVEPQLVYHDPCKAGPVPSSSHWTPGQASLSEGMVALQTWMGVDASGCGNSAPAVNLEDKAVPELQRQREGSVGGRAMLLPGVALMAPRRTDLRQARDDFPGLPEGGVHWGFCALQASGGLAAVLEDLSRIFLSTTEWEPWERPAERSRFLRGKQTEGYTAPWYTEGGDVAAGGGPEMKRDEPLLECTPMGSLRFRQPGESHLVKPDIADTVGKLAPGQSRKSDPRNGPHYTSPPAVFWGDIALDEEDLKLFHIDKVRGWTGQSAEGTGHGTAALRMLGSWWMLGQPSTLIAGGDKGVSGHSSPGLTVHLVACGSQAWAEGAVSMCPELGKAQL